MKKNLRQKNMKPTAALNSQGNKSNSLSITGEIFSRVEVTVR